jgi:hypothetical protein
MSPKPMVESMVTVQYNEATYCSRMEKSSAAHSALQPPPQKYLPRW